MKNPAIILIIAIFPLMGLNSAAQDDKIVLQPENGKEYIYEFRNITYWENEKGEKRNMLIRVKTFKVKVDNESPDGKKFLNIKLTENTIENPNSDITCFKDYRFPEYREENYDERPPDFYEGLLCRVSFRYSLNLKTYILNLKNRLEVLEKIKDHLAEKGFSEDEIDKIIEIIDKEIIGQITSLIDPLFQFNVNEFEGAAIDSTNFKTCTDHNHSQITITQNRFEQGTGLMTRKITIDISKNILTGYYSTELDSLDDPNRFGRQNFLKKYNIREIKLKEYSDIKPDSLIISGIIENPGAKKVTLAMLKNPFGNELHQITVFLDEKNSFRIKTKIEYAGLIFLQFGIYHSNNTPPALCLYTEPGSEIHFEARGESFPWDIEFKGDHTCAEKLLYDFREKYNIFHERINLNRIGLYSGTIAYNDIINAYKEFNAFTEKYKNQIPANVFDFITNELRAYLYYAFFDIYGRYRNKPDFPFGYYNLKVPDDLDIEHIQRTLDSLDLYKIYNEHGVYSRFLARNYLSHHFIKVQKVKEVRYPLYILDGVTPGFYYINDPDYQVQLARNALTGHPLYNNLVEIFLNELRLENQFISNNKIHTLKKLDEYFDLMIRKCDDNEFIDEIKKIKINNLKWQQDYYVPDIIFFDIEGKEKQMKDFLGKKPAVFYVTSDWSVERYYWDRIAKENTEFNVVLVTDGSNFREWKEYTLKAEPVAYQLYLDSHKNDLLDVFMNNSRHYIAYDKNGKLLGISNNLKEIIKMAGQSLEDSDKGPNKSQMILIIIILGSIMLISLISFLFWRWRARQRFLKEQQQRRLRELELTAIRSRMNPHFLFNCLNSVQNLVRKNMNREAHLYLADFAGLIRKVLQNSEKEEVSLAEELEMVQQYLNLEKLRFDFDFNITVDKSIDAYNTMVPSVLLQPFAENAIIHGLQNKAGNRTLKIEVIRLTELSSMKQISKKDNLTKNDEDPVKPPNNILAHKGYEDRANAALTGLNLTPHETQGILIIIEDNGVGREATKNLSSATNGKGSKLLKERLEILSEKQKNKYYLEIIDMKDNGSSGTRVEIFIPEEK
jgi:hypothetical protein